jgi:hypothetical protein
VNNLGKILGYSRADPTASAALRLIRRKREKKGEKKGTVPFFISFPWKLVRVCHSRYSVCAGTGSAGMTVNLLPSNIVGKRLQSTAPAWMFQFSQSFSFYLPDSLTSHFELLANFFQSMLVSIS